MDLTKNNLMSFIYQVGSINSRIKNDIFNEPFIKIKDYKKVENNFSISGTIIVSLSFIYQEQTIFEIKGSFNKNELIINNTQSSKCLLSNVFSEKRDEKAVKGNPLKTLDRFMIKSNNNTNYLIHTINNKIDSVYEVDSNYSIKDGFSKVLKKVSLEVLNPKKKTKRKIRMIIDNYL